MNKTNLLLSTLAGYVVASLIQSLINTYHSPFALFQRFLSLRVIPSYPTDREEEERVKGKPYTAFPLSFISYNSNSFFNL